MKQESHHYKKSFLQLRERKFRSTTFMSSIFYYNYEMVIHEWQKHNTRFLSLSLSLQTPLSLSQTHKNQKRKGGGMDLLIWFQALPYILLFLNWYFHLFNQAWLCILLLLVDPFFSHFLNIEVALSLSLSFLKLFAYF